MTSSVDPEEVAKFERMAHEWWDPNGNFKPLHKMNPCRLGYITEQIAWHEQRDLNQPEALNGLKILDIGCGGGLLSEPMARLGADVTGADAATTNIEVARQHAKKQNLKIDYQNTLAEDLVQKGNPFDVVLAMEVIEHVAEPAEFVRNLFALLKPGGLAILSTLNRNPKSYLFAIIGAEHVMRWLPKGTHDWNKFITPDELSQMGESAGFEVFDRKGMVYNPLNGQWSHSRRDLSVNYVTAMKKPL